MARRVALYIEPVVFRNDPGLLKVWGDWAASLVVASAFTGPETHFCLISSATLCSRFQEQSAAIPTVAHTIALRQDACLASLDFDRSRYSADLFAPESAPPVNEGLVDALGRAAQTFPADIVLSFSQNRYLRSAFGMAGGVLSSELSPLPRRQCPPSMFLDPSGHQTESLLVRAAKTVLDASIDEDEARTIIGAWERRIGAPTRAQARLAEVSEFLAAHRRGRRIVMLAMQPPDWLTYEGCYGPIAPDNLLAQVAHGLPEGWAVVPMYHPLYALPPELEAVLQQELPNVVFAPHALSCGGAEVFLDQIDAVATISSTVGLQGVLWGKPLIALGNSFLSGLGYPEVADLATAVGPTPHQRAALLRFLTHRYCHEQRRLFGEAGYLNRFLQHWADAGFSSAPWLDFRDYDPRSADRLLAPDRI